MDVNPNEADRRAEAERAWIEHVRPMRQRLFFESERDEWIARWLEERDDCC